MRDEIKKICSAYSRQLSDYRRHLHQNPELSFEEVKTAAWIREKLTALNIPILDNIRGNSVVGVIDSQIPGPTIAFRADIDALPIQEETNLPYHSNTSGVMHACGHDLHTATLLCLADALVHHKEMMKGKVKLIFQQAEEVPPGGALALCEDGVMEDVDRIFCYHVTNAADIGQIMTGFGARTAGIATYNISVTGVGGHGGFPQKAINPINAAAELVNQIYQIVPLHVAAHDTALITVGYLLSNPSKATNVIPAEAVMGGNIRTMDNGLIDEIIGCLRKICEGVAAMTGCSCELEAVKGYPAVINTELETRMVMEAVKELDYDLIIPPRASMGGEDFAQYLLEKPGAFLNVGVCDPERSETKVPGHNCKFNPDERGMTVAMEVLMATYLNAINPDFE